MKSYHLTPKLALKIFDEAGGILDIDDKCPLAVSATDLANTINLALDKVLGEPTYFGLTKDHSWLSITQDQYENLQPKMRMMCYAPKEQS